MQGQYAVFLLLVVALVVSLVAMYGHAIVAKCLVTILPNVQVD